MNKTLIKLKNNLRLLTVPMPESQSAIVTVWVKTGSRNEDKKVQGISHFLEHMVFKGSLKRPSAKAISEVVDSIGGEFNAATSKDYTLFYIKSGTTTLETAVDVLSDMVINPLLVPEEIEREKGTIIQEIAMYEDTPQRNIHDIFENLIFEGHHLEMDIAGTTQSVKRITQNDFKKHRQKFYYPENMLVSIAGGVTQNTTQKLVEKYFIELPNSRITELQTTKNFENKQKKPRLKLKNKKTEQANFIIGFGTDGRKYRNRYAQGILSAIMGANMSSRLFIEVRERRGLAYFVRTSTERYQDTGYMGTYAGVDPNKAEEAIKVILDQCYGVASKKYPISKKEFDKALGYLKGRFALSLEESEVVSDFYSEPELFDNERLTPKEVLARLEKVTIDEVYEEAEKLFKPERLNLAIIGPYKNDDKFARIVK